MTVPSQVKIIAEAAQGFEGDETLARLLVSAAAAGGADAVKFQLVIADEIATPEYQHYGLFRRLELSAEQWGRVAQVAAKKSVELMFDVYGPRSLQIAGAVGASAVKIHATDFFNHALVEQAIAGFPVVYFSVGGIEPEEIDEFVERWSGGGAALVMLCGFQAEPTALSDTNLMRLAAAHERWPAISTGFMDHADGDSDVAGWLGLLALPFRVAAIEKHLTLHRKLELEDYISALAPDEFRAYVQRIRAAEAALGSPSLALSPAEQRYRRKALKTVVATRSLPQGAIASAADLTLLRTPMADDAEPCYAVERVAGRRLRRSVGAGEPVLESLLE